MAVADARSEALRMLSAMAAGEDPESSSKRKRPTVVDCLEAYMAEHCATRAKQRTIDSYRDLIDRYLGPRFGKVLADELTHRMVDRMMTEMADRPATANKCLALLKACMQKAMRWGMRAPAKGNPCDGTEPHPEKPRETYLEAFELAAVLKALSAVSQDSGRWHAATCLQALALTGCRRDELRLVQADWIDWDRGIVNWPDTKTGAGSLHLSGAALELLARARDRIRDGRPHLFRGADPSLPLPKSTLYRAWKEALELAVTFGVDPSRLEGLRPHDLRHSFASLGLSSGLTLDDVGRLLRHRDTKSTRRYAKHLPSRERELAHASAAFLGVTPALTGIP